MIFNSTLNEGQIEYLYNTQLTNYYPENLTIYINNELDYSDTGNFNDTYQYSANISKINNILANQEDCCNFTFYSDTDSYLEYSLVNAEVYTNLTIEIYDRITSNLITEDTTVIIQNYGTFNTSTGIVNIDNFTTSTQTFTTFASSTGYPTEQINFAINDINDTTVEIYLLNTSSANAGNLIVETYDEFYNYIVGANVKLLEYVPLSDSFTQVSQCYSDSNGECIFNVELNAKYYIVQATYQDGDDTLFAQSTDTGQLIKLDETVIALYLRTSDVFVLPETHDLVIIPSNTELVGNTSYLTATFNDVSNTDHTVCIGYYTVNGLNEVEQINSCEVGSSGIVNFAGGYLLDRDYTWVAKIYVIEETGQETVYYSYRYDASSGTIFTSWGSEILKVIIFALVLALLGLSLYMKNMKVFAIGIIVLSPMSLRWHPNLMGGVTMSFIIVLAVCILYLTARKEDLS